MSSPGATQIDSANTTSKSRLKSVLDLSYVRTFFFVIKVILIVSIGQNILYFKQVWRFSKGKVLIKADFYLIIIFR